MCIKFNEISPHISSLCLAQLMAVFSEELKSENFSLSFSRKIIVHIVILKLTVCLTSTDTVRMKSLCDRVSIFALQQQGTSTKFTS